MIPSAVCRTGLLLVLTALLTLIHTRVVTAQPAAQKPDLVIPPISQGPPAPGKRVRQQLQLNRETDLYHLIYLPTDWQPGKKFPVIVEYAGNQWKTSPGTVEGSHLGYGISGGTGVIWVCLPFVNSDEKRNQLTWWGDVEATVDYCKQTVKRICQELGGDPKRVFLAGFSRGSIACNFIGLHDDDIATLWRGFICHSHYDGVQRWSYFGSDEASAVNRLKRLKGRPQFVSHEKNVTPTQAYLNRVAPNGNFTFQAIQNFPHTDTWVLYDVPERKMLRDWFEKWTVEE